jgi:predicted RNase H-like nuclease (RuvC/YqgF family)
MKTKRKFNKNFKSSTSKRYGKRGGIFGYDITGYKVVKSVPFREQREKARRYDELNIEERGRNYQNDYQRVFASFTNLQIQFSDLQNEYKKLKSENDELKRENKSLIQHNEELLEETNKPLEKYSLEGSI